MKLADSVQIHVATEYLEDQSLPMQDRYVFAYTITITNLGDETVTLLSRHWLIRDGNDKLQEVEGEGVVGLQPEIAAGSSFEYTSGAMLETAYGTMEGSYQMRTASGSLFDAPIALFSLAKPNALH